MISPARFARPIAGIAVLLALAGMTIILAPPYLDNWKLQRFVNATAEDPATAALPAEVIRARILNRAGTLGLPVHTEDVQVKQSENALRIDVLYVVHVDFASYSVDLHFRPAAGGA